MQIQVLQKDELSSLKGLISGFTGFTFNSSREHSLVHALSAFSKEHNCSTPLQLEHLLRTNQDLMKKFTECLLVHETYFFREKESLEHLITLLQRRCSTSAPSSQPVRIWSAGCSTGEEPYSLALLLLDSPFRTNFRIVATDISQQALNHANLAQYSEWSMRSLGAEQRLRFFDKGIKTYRLKDESAKQRVTFLKANLTEQNQLSAEWSALDAIICRNVLIYFESNVVGKLAKIFYDQLKPGGILLTGASDPPLVGFTDFELEYTKTGIIYKKPDEKTAKGSARRSQSTTIAPSRRSLNKPVAASRKSIGTAATPSRRSLNARSSQAHVSAGKEA